MIVLIVLVLYLKYGKKGNYTVLAAMSGLRMDKVLWQTGMKDHLNFYS